MSIKLLTIKDNLHIKLKEIEYFENQRKIEIEYFKNQREIEFIENHLRRNKIVRILES